MAQREPQANDLREHSTAELVKQLSQQTSALARKEVELAKAELAEKGKQAGIGAGMFGGAGILALYGLALLAATAVLALAQGVDGWVAGLIVAVLFFAAAGIVAVVGRSRMQEATPLKPEQTAESVQEDVQWAKTQARSARR
jgi:hypothetical protein